MSTQPSLQPPTSPLPLDDLARYATFRVAYEAGVCEVPIGRLTTASVWDPTHSNSFLDFLRKRIEERKEPVAVYRKGRLEDDHVLFENNVVLSPEAYAQLLVKKDGKVHLGKGAYDPPFFQRVLRDRDYQTHLERLSTCTSLRKALRLCTKAPEPLTRVRVRKVTPEEAGAFLSLLEKIATEQGEEVAVFPIGTRMALSIELDANYVFSPKIYDLLSEKPGGGEILPRRDLAGNYDKAYFRQRTDARQLST